ncbi:hypothetical protein [Paenibacillus solani]|nr:hypothetical protein [Paenibacillus solani]
MTMVIAHVWQNKIIIMADSRSSARDKDGKMLEFDDKANKIIEIQNKLFIGHAGLRKIPIGEHFDLNEITMHFIKMNQNKLFDYSGELIFRGLVETWNRTLSEKLGRNPFDLNNRFCLLMGIFENDNGKLIPKIHSYQSHFNEFQWGGTKAVIGDDPVYEIILPYYETDNADWTFDEIIDFYRKGFSEVMNKVETVGGPIDIFVLDEVPEKSYWLDRK